MDLGELLDPMGRPLADYRGTGTLQLDSGDEIDCPFRARQTASGDIFLVVEDTSVGSIFSILFGGPSVERFHGTTDSGARIEIRGRIITRDLPPSDANGEKSWLSLGAPRVSVFHSDAPATESRFGLTNVRLKQPVPLTLRLEGGTAPFEARLRRVDDGRVRYQRARATRGVEVTAELIFEGPQSDAMKRVAGDVCHLLSIAQGSVVEWVYIDEYARAGLARRHHHNRRTREYAPVPAVRTDRPKWPVDYIARTYPTYVRRRDDWQLHRGTVARYLEAKAEADYLEARGVKLAVALEGLAHRYLESSEATLSQFVLPRKEFEKLAPDLKSEVKGVLRRRGVEKRETSKIANKVKQLNRESFRAVTRKLSSLLDLRMGSKERGQFIDSRNTLVHQGQFYCKAVERGEVERRSDPFPSPTEEYFFMVTVLDRIFLRLVGYDGKHRDWTAFPDRKLVPVRR